MSDRVQIGVEVDADLWNELREDVRERKGKVRGVLGDEVENAIRHYLHNGPDRGTPQQLNDIEARLNRIEGAVGVEATDGGTDTSQPAMDTHTRDSALDVPDERPHPRGDTKAKVRWLADAALDAHGVALDELSMIHEDTIRDAIQDEYDFTADTTAEYVPKVVDQLGLVDHPSADPYADVLYVTEAEREDLIEKQREQARDDARETTERLEADE